jgi:uncharacterized protein YlxW (UPF0749 family)
MGKTKRQDMSTERVERNLIKRLKEMVKSQQKELNKLKKELNRREDVSEEYKELLNETAPKYEVDSRLECPKCFATAVIIDLGRFKLYRCNMCDWRQKK